MEEKNLQQLTQDFYEWLINGPCPAGSVLAKFRAREPDPQRLSDEILVLVADFSREETEKFTWLLFEWTRTLSPEKRKRVVESLLS